MEANINDIAASYQEAVVDALVHNVREALITTGEKKLSLAGGVAANSRLREAMTTMCDELGVAIYLPEIKYCGDNAAMIGTAAYYMYQKGETSPIDLNAIPSISLNSI